MKNLEKIKMISLLVLLFVFQQSARSQKFYAQVSSKVVQVGQMFEVAFVINASASNFTPPNFSDFEVAGGPNQSSSIQVVNGQMSQNITLSYVLVPKREGKLTIGAASIISNGQKLESAPITIEAVKGNTGQQSQASGGSQGAAAGKPDGSDVFIRTIVSKQKCFLGEQLIVSQKVYSRHQIVGFQKFNPPTYEGFWSQTLESTSGNQQSVENLEGVNYYTYEIFRNQVTPNKSGKVSLSPVEGEVVVRRQTNAKPRNIFEQFFGAAGYEDIAVKARSKSMAVDVMELPKEGKPEFFNGAVGSFAYKVETSKQTLKANEAFNLKITISGKGNLKLIDAQVLKLPESFETYEPKVAESQNSKVFDYLVIPREEGDFVLDNLAFSYFDLDTKKYITIPSPQINVKVLQGDKNSAGAQVYTPQNEIKETENDIRYIKKGDFEMTKTEKEFFNSAGHVALMLAPILMLSGALLWRRQHIKSNSNIVAVKERKAAKVAKKQLVMAEKHMHQNKKDEFYTEVLTAINAYLSYKLNIPSAEVSHQRIREALNNRRVDVNRIQKLLNTVETAEYAKYAPGAVSGNLKEVYEDTVMLITELEEELNSKKV